MFLNPKPKAAASLRRPDEIYNRLQVVDDILDFVSTEEDIVCSFVRHALICIAVLRGHCRSEWGGVASLGVPSCHRESVCSASLGTRPCALSFGFRGLLGSGGFQALFSVCRSRTPGLDLRLALGGV